MLTAARRAQRFGRSTTSAPGVAMVFTVDELLSCRCDGDRTGGGRVARFAHCRAFAARPVIQARRRRSDG